ncbi:hypothetical protein [Foetidibacter luteolus]|uniref:hypothetical protein n=1 Tax=Foetidibacter luteolus TaxID=2608880 RepID=UPI00129B28E3|nr:hypothetical protein [Foetidibacter luteolus]
MNLGLFQHIFRYDALMPLIALLVYAMLYKRIGNKENLVLVYLVINIVFAGVTNYMGYYNINNLSFYHFYTLFEQLYISGYILYKITGKKFSRLYIIINTVFTLFWLADILYLEDLHGFNSNTATLSGFLILLLCMYYMLQLSKRDEILHFQTSPTFWIISAFLVFSAVSILVFAVYAYYTKYGIEEGRRIFRVMRFTIIAKFIMISIGLLCYYKQRRHSIPRTLLL